MSLRVILLFNHVGAVFMLEIQVYHSFHYNPRFTSIVLLFREADTCTTAVNAFTFLKSNAIRLDNYNVAET
jgi:hypothetical protein